MLDNNYTDTSLCYFREVHSLEVTSPANKKYKESLENSNPETRNNNRGQRRPYRHATRSRSVNCIIRMLGGFFSPF